MKAQTQSPVRRSAGFTLLEMLVVMILTAMVSTIASPDHTWWNATTMEPKARLMKPLAKAPERPRAVSQTKMTISQRAQVDGVLVDVVCTGRFYDFFEKRAGRWGMVRRQPIYEKDRMDAVDPQASLKLDASLLQLFPEGYRHLAYLQMKIGYKVAKGGLPGLKGPEVEKLYADGAAWLAGAATPGRPELRL